MRSLLRLAWPLVLTGSQVITILLLHDYLTHSWYFQGRRLHPEVDSEFHHRR